MMSDYPTDIGKSFQADIKDEAPVVDKTFRREELVDDTVAVLGSNETPVNSSGKIWEAWSGQASFS